MSRTLAPRFAFKARGVTFASGYPGRLHDLARTWGEHGEGSLIREPNNPHDPNAVAVFAGGGIVGHVPAGLAARLGPEIDDGARFRVTDMTVLVSPGHEDRPGLLVEVERV